MTPPSIAHSPHGVQIAYHKIAGNENTAAPKQPAQNGGTAPGLIFLGGFRSDMTGTKALALEAHSIAQAQTFIRFDYRGHGQSSGQFHMSTLSDWLADSLFVIDELSTGPQILIGSSMGGWLALLAALARPQRICGLILLAPAPDFTEKLMWDHFSEETRRQIMEQGHYAQPSAYDPEPTLITRNLIEDGRKHLLLDKPIDLAIPIRLIHGDRDPDVPWQHSITLMDRLTSDDVVLHLIKNGDHRLSSPADIARLKAITADLSAQCRQQV
ncbi:alpha/beta hydrolase [Iodidimonas nitroreducens]|uniref:Palmitoyl-protein thioesterase ABHD10, mitochondrial n=1 Tax=Iodidimonas nitroreducens TaxID=1236968 RepID=A0A5A7N240_9PROT|nr:alpha/beta hydrolase [Iodidimonas nitroreducens]GAK34904.1 mycophenolic acid acyl-glucuronide esterase, mitochondrial [alpha proteobacterium Q-1]GER02351.1 alpha/beta hydrolase [Iodidimonas nitroreducens]